MRPLTSIRAKARATVFATALVALSFAAPASAYPIVVSEVQVRGTAGSFDEFIEFFNVTDNPVALTSDWSLWGGSSCSPSMAFSGQVVPARGHLLLTGAGYDGPVASDGGFFPGGLADQGSGNTGGGVAVFRGSQKVDALGWAFDFRGFPEGECFEASEFGGWKFASPATSGDVSFARKGADQGQDTGDNSTDFDYPFTSDPQNSSSAAAPDTMPVSRSAPTLSGNAQVGGQLATSTGLWTGGGPYAYAYQWRRCDSAGASCSDLPEATLPTYALGPADVGHRLRAHVTVTNSAGSASAESAASAVVRAAPVNTADPPSEGGGSAHSPSIPPTSTTSTPTTPPIPPTSTTSTPTTPPAQCVVPKLRGMRLAQAKRALKRAHCALGKVTKKRVSRRKVGRVLSQRRRAGTKLARGSRIALVLGKRR